MKAKIYSHTTLIGTSDLSPGDENMGHLFGIFIPNEPYFQSVQRKVWGIVSIPSGLKNPWNKLRLNVQLENGYFLFPQGGITIDDHPEFLMEPKRIDIAGIDSYVSTEFNRFYTQDPFVEEPWFPLDIKQKLALEDELSKEIGTAKRPLIENLLSLFRRNHHPLSDFEFSALCRDSRNDDVVFAVYKEGFGKQIALIHLTWKSKKELDPWPRRTFFENFQQFKRLKGLTNGKSEQIKDPSSRDDSISPSDHDLQHLLVLLDKAEKLLGNFRGGYSKEFFGAEEFHEALIKAIENLRAGKWEVLHKLWIWFAPTGSWDDFVRMEGVELGNEIFELISKMKGNMIQ